MAVNILNSDSTTQWIANTIGDTYVVQEDVYLAVLGTAITGTAAAVTSRKFKIDGHVIGEGAGSGILIGFDEESGGYSTIQISATGSVSGEADGIAALGGGLSLVNDGNLTGGTTGLRITGDANSVLNHGTIFSYDGAGINSQGDSAKIANYGSIAGETDGVLLAGDYSRLVNGGNVTSADPNTGYAAVRMTGHNTHFVNAGIVTISAGDAVLGYAGIQTVRNHGHIAGGVDLAGDADTFYNDNGSVSGDIHLGTGDDTFMNTNGSVTGRIYGELGNDRYYIDDASTNIFEYSGSGSGNDAVYSSVSYSLKSNFELLFLQGGADLNGNGNSADNELTGNAGNNNLHGRSGDDYFYFSGGNDVFNGGAGSDTVYYATGTGVSFGVTINLETGKGGGAAAGETFLSIENILGSEFGDRLVGDAANNLISGVSGNDFLTGGGGKDVFDYFVGYGKDTISDFKDKIDTIELDGPGIDSFDDLDGLISQKGKNVVIDFSDISAGNMLIIRNADLSDFSSKDFMFG